MKNKKKKKPEVKIKKEKIYRPKEMILKVGLSTT